ncbi:MAG: hypothetical protein KAJ16_13755, partial [Calditrichia bacterium]|nr:hypothetical protein [Calditrichia bacterium]
HIDDRPFNSLFSVFNREADNCAVNTRNKKRTIHFVLKNSVIGNRSNPFKQMKSTLFTKAVNRNATNMP